MSDSMFYTEREMLAEMKAAIESMGGEIQEIDFSRRIFKIDIDHELEADALVLIEDIMTYYSQMRDEVEELNPFTGVYDIIEELDIKDIDDDKTR